MSAKRMSIKDVARVAQVSVGTVSNVLNRPAAVAVATRERVQQAIVELGFVRNDTGRQLREGSSRTIAYVVLDGSNPFFTDVARGIDEVARANALALYTCNTAGDPDRESEFLDLLLEQRVRGVLVTPVNQELAMLERLKNRGMPVVLVDRNPGPEWCSVGVDDVLGAQLAITHLLEQGHERIAFVGGPLSTPQVADRYEGSVKAITSAGGTSDDLVLIDTQGLTVSEGRDAGERIVGLSQKQRPTATFCANDLVALGLLQQMTAMGVDVPSEMAIVGYDDIEFAGAAAVPLSSIRQPRALLGRTAAELLLLEADDDAAHEHQQVVFEPELIVRSSSLKM